MTVTSTSSIGDVEDVLDRLHLTVDPVDGTHRKTGRITEVTTSDGKQPLDAHCR